jgi:hypothetical protein
VSGEGDSEIVQTTRGRLSEVSDTCEPNDKFAPVPYRRPDSCSTIRSPLEASRLSEPEPSETLAPVNVRAKKEAGSEPRPPASDHVTSVPAESAQPFSTITIALIMIALIVVLVTRVMIDVMPVDPDAAAVAAADARTNGGNVAARPNDG